MHFKGFENPPQFPVKIDRQYPEKNQKNEQEYLFSLLQHQLVDAVSGVFENSGYSIAEIAFIDDDGFDIITKQADGKKCVIECKCNDLDNPVGLKNVQNLYASKLTHKAENAVFVTTGDFTNEAYKYAFKQNIRLIDGKKLLSMIKIACP